MEIFRKAELSDLEFMTLLRSENNLPSCETDFYREQMEDLIKNVFLMTYIIEENGEKAGFFSFGIPEKKLGHIQIELRMIYISPDFRLKRIGMKAFKFIRSYCLDKGVKEAFSSVERSDERALSFSKAMGGTLSEELVNDGKVAVLFDWKEF